MSADARFADGAERALNLGAMDADDLAVLSALCQDAVLPASEMRYFREERRFAMLINRFRWEDEVEGARPERVRAVLIFDNVTAVASQGVSKDEDTVLSILALDWAEATEPSGAVVVTLAGDGALKLEAEALEVRLKDVEQPYRAISGNRPDHDA